MIQIMLNVVNKLKEGSIKTISSAANTLLSTLQNASSRSSDSTAQQDGSSASLLLTTSINNYDNNNDSDSDSEDDQQPFLNEILEILNVNPEVIDPNQMQSILNPFN